MYVQETLGNGGFGTQVQKLQAEQVQFNIHWNRQTYRLRQTWVKTR